MDSPSRTHEGGFMKGEKKEKEVNGVPATVTINGLELRKKFANLYGTFGSDLGLEANGVWISYELQTGNDFEIKIKRGGSRNVEWRRVYNQVFKPHDKDKLSEQESQFLLAEVYSRTIVVDWKNIKDNEGKDVPFNIENCMELLCFMPELLSKVINDAHERGNFQMEEVESTAKN